VGLESIPGTSNEYRLGTIFLKNFYTALDFDKDLIIIGVNKGSSAQASATIDGHVGNPYKKAVRRNWSGTFILILFLVIIGVAVFYYICIRHK